MQCVGQWKVLQKKKKKRNLQSRGAAIFQRVEKEMVTKWLSPFSVHLKLSQHCLLIGYTPIENKKLKNKFKKLSTNSLFYICAVLSHSVVFDTLQPHRLQPTRLLCPCGRTCASVQARILEWVAMPSSSRPQFKKKQCIPYYLSTRIQSISAFFVTACIANTNKDVMDIVHIFL